MWYILNSNIALCSLYHSSQKQLFYSTLSIENWKISLRNWAATNERGRKSWQVYVAGNNIQAHLSHVVIAWIYLLVGIRLRVNVAFGKQKLCAIWIKKNYWSCFNRAILVSSVVLQVTSKKLWQMLVLLLFPTLTKMNHPVQRTHINTRLQRVQIILLRLFFQINTKNFHGLLTQSLYQTKTFSRKKRTEQMYPCMTQA